MVFAELFATPGILFRSSLLHRKMPGISCLLQAAIRAGTDCYGTVLVGLSVALAMVGIALIVAPVSAAPQSGQMFDSWQIGCDAAFNSNPAECYLYQGLFLKNSRKRVLRVAIGRFGESQTLAAMITLPLGILLSPGAAMRIDDNQPIAFGFQYCNLDAGCVGILSLDRHSLEALDRGRMIEVVFYNRANEPVMLSIPLSGFSEGIRALFN